MVQHNRNLDRRANWFDRQFIRAQDLVDADDYHLDRRRRHLRQLHTPGVAEGLEVRGAEHDGTVKVSAGTAIDAHGRELILLTEVTSGPLPGGDVTKAAVYLVYREAETDASTDPGVTGNTRIQEITEIVFWELTPQNGTEPASPAQGGLLAAPGIKLAEVQLEKGKLTDSPKDARQWAGAVLGQFAVSGLTLRRNTTAEDLWPRITTSEADGGLRFATGGAPTDERMRIDADGHVAIGTSDPLSVRLTVESDGVPLGLRATGIAADAGGLWRLRHQADIVALDMNTAPDGDFTTAATPLALTALGPLTSQVTIGAGANGTLRTRHIDGKSHENDEAGPLFLNFATETPVVVGQDAHPTAVVVAGEIESRSFPADDGTPGLARLALTARSAGGKTETWKLYTAAVGGGWGVEPGAFELWQYPDIVPRFKIRPNGDTVLVPSGGIVELPGGASISASGRLHVSGDEILYLLNKNGVTIGREWGGDGSLYAQGNVKIDGRLDARSNIVVAGAANDPDFPDWSGGGVSTHDLIIRGGIYGPGSIEIDGTITGKSKKFVIEHPLDPARSLAHASLEGPENGVYYRGEGRLVDGAAEIKLPAYFEALTRPDGRTVHLTPRFGDAAEPVTALAASAVENGRFQVRSFGGDHARHTFYWEVRAVRADLPELMTEIPKRQPVDFSRPSARDIP